jgi:YfiH family protein
VAVRWIFGGRVIPAVPEPWTELDQVHGAAVVVVDRPGGRSGVAADAAVSATPGCVLAIRTADCVPLLLWDHAAPVVAAVHAGWQGLERGVVRAAVKEMRSCGARLDRVVGRIGPHIRPEQYEFGPADLTRLAMRFGPDVVSATATGAPALHLAAGVRVALGEAGVNPDGVTDQGHCTAADLDFAGEHRFHSWRARADAGRNYSFVWIEEESTVPQGALSDMEYSCTEEHP